MSFEWEKKITDRKVRKVFEALSGDSSDFWTVEGLSKETGLSDVEVQSILEGHSEMVRQLVIPHRDGRVLFALRSKSVGARELFATARAFVTKSLV